MNDQNKDSHRTIGISIPPNITFRLTENSNDPLVLDEEGFIYHGKRIEDAGEAHSAFLDVFYSGDNVARSTYIYLIRSFEERKVVGAFTVKHETVEWAVRNGWGPHNADLSRIHDGIHSDKTEVEIPWPTPENQSKSDHT